MYTGSHRNCLFDTRTSIIYAEENILKTQARIYQASRLYKKNIVLKEQILSLSNQDIILLIAKNAIRAIKKKLAYLVFIARKY